MIRVRHLFHRRGRDVVLDDVSLTVEPGEVLGIVGAHAAGKSTLLRVLATLETPTAGRVEVAGHDVVDDPVPARRATGYVGEGAPWPRGFTVREALARFARACRVDASVVGAALEVVDLQDLADRDGSTLSPGEGRKLHLARALLHDPSVLLLDGLLGGLDDASRADIVGLLADLADMGRAIVITSGTDTLAPPCTRVVRLRRGVRLDDRGARPPETARIGGGP